MVHSPQCNGIGENGAAYCAFNTIVWNEIGYTLEILRTSILSAHRCSFSFSTKSRLACTSAAFVIGGLSLIGVPGTAGFISKWLLIEAALETGYWLVAILIIASSLFAVIYIWKIIEVLYFSESSESYNEVSVLTLMPIWILALFCIFLGINTSLTVDVANMATEILFK